ncbi:MAG: hypothetical protein IKC64_01940 [Clostridia bacterium]|nr:hypothetical protein [Clostridia bacterium]
MLKGARDVAIIGTFLALLLASQFALSAAVGVEIVTVMFLSFCYCLGVKRGVVLAFSFSALRCIIFGFFPAVVILYFIYYPLFAVTVGAIGNSLKRKFSFKILLLLIAVALVLTVCFTMLDNIITPLVFSFDLVTAQTYFVASTSVMLIQLVSVAVSTAVLFLPFTTR